MVFRSFKKMVQIIYKNKKRILDKINYIDANFITTSPDVLKFLIKKIIILYQIQQIHLLKHLINYKKNFHNDVFFAMSHGVHRGI